MAAAVSAVLCAAAIALGGAGAASASTTWLCRPGVAPDPCTPGLTTTSVSPAGVVGAASTAPSTKHPKIDCFYVYPTVSNQPTVQATKRIDPEERSIALFQAARYSSECRVYAPMYRQISIKGLLTPAEVTAKMRQTAYDDVAEAWRTYLKKYNKGRGVVVIGHSQGAFVLRRLLRAEVDGKAAQRRRIVSAILLGGNVLVRKGSDRGGDFADLPACRKAGQLGCVIAFSTFGEQPPANAVFGVPGRIASASDASTTGMEVLCTNPAALGGGSGMLDSIYPSAPFAPGTAIGIETTLIGLPVPAVSTTWIETRGAFSAACSSGGVHGLVITGHDGAPTLKPLPDATWGLHLVDANIGLGDLVGIVHAQAAAYARR